MPAASDRGHTILVVDDEVLIRVVIADYLRECGFQVIETGSADEALTLLNSDIPVDLVFSDVQIPGNMNGVGLARWIRERRPEVKIVLTSGYANSAEEAADLCDGGSLMSKPYDEQLVVERIKRLLGKGKRGANGAA